MINYQISVKQMPELEWLGSGYQAKLEVGGNIYCRSGLTAQDAKTNVFEDYQGAVENWEDFCNEEPEEYFECLECGQNFSSVYAYQNHFETVWSSYYEAPETRCTYDRFDEVDL